MKNKRCPECTNLGQDRKGDHLFLMKDGETWTCQKPYHEPYYERDGEACTLEKPEEVVSRDITSELSRISKLSPAWIRDVPDTVWDKYRVKVEHDTATGSPLKHYYPITKGGIIVDYKVRTLPKTFCTLKSGVKQPELFGMLSYNKVPDVLVICGGELDAPAAHHMLTSFSGIMCVAPPLGENINCITDNIDFINSCGKVVFCPDQDKVGLELVEKAALHISRPLFTMKFSEKDASDMFVKGKAEEFKDAYVNARKYVPTCIVSVEDVAEEAMVAPTVGLSYPFEGLNKITYGLHKARIISIGAAAGCGKTTFTKQLQTHLIHEHKKSIGIISLEETPKDVVRELAGFIMNKPLYEPGCVYSEEELRDTISDLKGLVYAYDHKGYKDWRDINKAIKAMISIGVQYFYIDPLSALVQHLEATDANRYLGEAMGDLMRMKDSEQITVFTINHLNAPKTGKDHGSGGRVYASQFSGSRAQERFSTDLWALERDQTAEDSSKNLVKLVSLKYRKPSKGGYFNMEYQESTGTLKEITSVGGF